MEPTTKVRGGSTLSTTFSKTFKIVRLEGRRVLPPMLLLEIHTVLGARRTPRSARIVHQGLCTIRALSALAGVHHGGCTSIPTLGLGFDPEGATVEQSIPALLSQRRPTEPSLPCLWKGVSPFQTIPLYPQRPNPKSQRPCHQITCASNRRGEPGERSSL